MVIDADFVFKFISVSIVLISALTAIYVRIMMCITKINTRQDAHEKHCEEHKQILNGDLKTIREDIKLLLQKLK